MRRFIHAVTIAGALTPAIAFAQTAPTAGTPAPTGGQPAAGSTSAPADGTTAPADGPNATARRAPGSTTSTSSSSTTATGGASASATASTPANPTTSSATAVGTPAGTATLPTAGGTPGQLSDRATPTTPAPRSAAPAPLPWRGSAFIIDNSVSFETLFPGSQLSPDPSFQTWLSFRPRWAITRWLSFRARQDMTYEWFNDNSTTRFHEPVFGDLWTDFVFTGIPRVAGIGFSTGIRFQWPVSLASRMRQNIFNLGLIVGASRAFELGRAGELSVSLAFVGTRPISAHTDAVVMGAGYNCQAFDGTPQICQGMGVMNTAFTLTGSLVLGYTTPVPGLSFSALGLLVNQWRQNTPDVTLRDRMGGSYEVPRSPTDQRFAQITFISLAADYEVQKWLSVSVAYWVSRSVLDPNGNYGNPFWSPGGNTRISLTMTIPIDEVYNAISGRNARAGAGGGGANTRGVTMNEPRRYRPRRSVGNDMARQLREQNVLNGFF